MKFTTENKKEMIRTQVMHMLNMDDASLKKYLEKECKHKDEILSCIAQVRDEAIADRKQHLFDQLCWLYAVVKRTEVLCP